MAGIPGVRPVPPPPVVDVTPRFCENCGAALVPDPRRYGFSSITGEPKIIDFGRCPNRRWWQTLTGGHHS